MVAGRWAPGSGVRTRVVMEATSDYWKPPFYLLEAAGFETWLVNAKDVKHLPGRPKTDRLDAVWLCKIAERQMIRPSFVPPEPIRRLRDLTRYRIDLVGERGRTKNRVEKLLEDAGIKLSVVASDIFGVSGRAMMDALVAGERDPGVLADLARTRMRTKIPMLREAFEGRFGDHHSFLLASMLAHIDAIDADITAIEDRIGQQINPFADAVARLDAIPGVGATAAQVIIAEIGVDMTRFPTAGHLSSWARFAPGVKESAGRSKGNGATGHGNRYLARALGEAAMGASKTDTFLGERYRRMAPTRQEESPGRCRTLHPGHHLAPARPPRHRVHRPRPRPLRPPRRHPTRHPPTPQRPARPRLPRHRQPRRITSPATPDSLQPRLGTSIFGLAGWNSITAAIRHHARDSRRPIKLLAES